MTIITEIGASGDCPISVETTNLGTTGKLPDIATCNGGKYFLNLIYYMGVML